MAGYFSLMKKVPRGTSAVIFGFLVVTLSWGETLYFNYHTAKINMKHVKKKKKKKNLTNQLRATKGNESVYYAPYKTELVTEDMPEGAISDVEGVKKIKYWKVKWDSIKEESR